MKIHSFRFSTRENFKFDKKALIMDEMKIIIESLLTGSQFEVAINENDKVLIVKSQIQKILGET